MDIDEEVVVVVDMVGTVVVDEEVVVNVVGKVVVAVEAVSVVVVDVMVDLDEEVLLN